MCVLERQNKWHMSKTLGTFIINFVADENYTAYLKYLKRSRQAADLVLQGKYHRILVVVA